MEISVGDRATRSLTLTAEAEVLSTHATKPVAKLGFTVRRQDGETVLEGEAVCYRFEGPQ